MTRSRFLKNIDDARKYAEIVKTGKGQAPSRKKVSLIGIAASYADGLILIALARLEEMLKKDELDPKIAVVIIETLKKYSDWATVRAGWSPPAKRGPGRPPKEKPTDAEGLGDDLDSAMGLD